MSKKIVVVGSLNADLVVTTPHAPAAGETVFGDQFHVFPGGKGANQAAAAARLLPGDVALIGLVGTDAFGPMLRRSLLQAGADLNALGSVEGSSGVALITVEAGGQNRIVIVSGANALVSEELVLESQHLLAAAKVVLLQLEIPLHTVQCAARLAHNAGATVMLDPAPARRLDRTLLQHVTWLTPNYSEACLLANLTAGEAAEAGLPRLLDDLLALGSEQVLLKLGEAGCALAMHSGERFRVPAFPVHAVDTTAAGDAFNAGFAVALAEGRTPPDAARWASAVGAIAVTRMGAQTSLPSRDEVDAFLQTHQSSQSGADL